MGNSQSGNRGYERLAGNRKKHFRHHGPFRCLCPHLPANSDRREELGVWRHLVYRFSLRRDDSVARVLAQGMNILGIYGYVINVGVCVCVRACVRACLRVCVRECVRA